MIFFSEPLFREQQFNINTVESRGLEEDVKKELFNYNQVETRNNYSDLIKLYSENIINKKYNNPFMRSLFDSGVALILKRDKQELHSNIEYKGQCLPGFLNLFVDVDGNYCICEKMGNNFILGNVEEGFDFEKSLAVYNTYLDIKEELCMDCWSVRLCNSCTLTAKDESKISIEGQKKMCGNLKDQIIQNLDIVSYLLINDTSKNYKEYFEDIYIKNILKEVKKRK